MCIEFEVKNFKNLVKTLQLDSSMIQLKEGTILFIVEDSQSIRVHNAKKLRQETKCECVNKTF